MTEREFINWSKKVLSKRFYFWEYCHKVWNANHQNSLFAPTGDYYRIVIKFSNNAQDPISFVKNSVQELYDHLQIFGKECEDLEKTYKELRGSRNEKN